MRRTRRGDPDAPPEYLDEDEQAEIIARFEASMRATREAWLSTISCLSLVCGVGVAAAYALDWAFLPMLLLRTSFGENAAASGRYVGVAAAAASMSFCLPAVGFYTRPETHIMYRWLAAGAAVPLCVFLCVLAWSQGATVLMGLLFIPVGYQGFCLLAVGVLHEPDASLASLKSAKYHHKKA